VLAVLVSMLVLGALAIPSMRITLFAGGEFGRGFTYVGLSMSGLSVNETLDRLTRPGEEILRSLPAVNYVRSSTSSGSVFLSVIPARGYSGQQLITQVSQAFNTHRYRFPKDMTPPSVGNWSPESMPLARVALGRGSLSEGAFTEFIDRVLIPALSTIPGVAQARVGHVNRRGELIYRCNGSRS
jgi:multidrug efflux pump subunit AcrB